MYFMSIEQISGFSCHNNNTEQTDIIRIAEKNYTGITWFGQPAIHFYYIGDSICE